jgi:hypothetical protein
VTKLQDTPTLALPRRRGRELEGVRADEVIR